MNEETSADIAAADQHLSESEALEYFQAASLYRECTRFVGAVHCAVDHSELHAKPGKTSRQRQPGRAGTHNQRIQHCRLRTPCTTSNILWSASAGRGEQCRSSSQGETDTLTHNQ